MSDYKGLLILDIDGTFFRWSLFLYMFEQLIDAGVFNKVVRHYFFEEEKAWRERRGSYDDYLYKVMALFDQRIVGVYAKDFEILAEKIVNDRKNEVYRYTRELIKQKKEAGWYSVAISCSPEPLVKKFAEYWKIDEAHAAKIKIEKGKYIEESEVPRDKSKLTFEIMARPEFADLAKENIWGIGDSEGDISFLELVGKPICFNPTLPLYQEAKRRGWQVVVERKNVIYEL